MPLPLTTFKRHGWAGMVDSGDLRSTEDARAHLLINMYPEQANVPSAALMRPGFKHAPAGFGAIVASHAVAFFFPYQFAGGTDDEIGALLISTAGAGAVYAYSIAGDSWSVKVAAAAFTAAGISFIGTSTAPRAFRWVLFNDKLIVLEVPSTTTEITVVWSLTGATVANLTGPLITGRLPRSLTVYYSKLVVGLFSTTYGRIIRWSEENDETLGYATGGYTNEWELSQTSQESLTEIVGTNEALFYWRETNIGKITGAMSSDFTTTGVHDSISEVIGAPQLTEGTGDSRQMTVPLVHEGTIYFVDQFSRPWALRDGSLLPIWKDIRRQFDPGGTARNWYEDDVALGTASHICYCSATNHLLFWYGVDGTRATVWAVGFDPESLRAQMFLEVVTAVGAEPTTVGYIEANQAVWLGTVNGKAMYLKLANVPSDSSGTAQVVIRTRVVDQPIGWNAKHEWHFDQIRPVVRSPEAVTATVRYTIPRTKTPVSQTVATAASAAAERKLAVGINAKGRWLQVTTAIALTGGGAFTGLGPAVTGWEVDAFALGHEPAVV